MNKKKTVFLILLTLFIVISLIGMTKYSLGSGGFFRKVSDLAKETITFTDGSVLFVGANQVVQNNANLFWDNTNFRLGIGSSTPAADLSIESAATTTAYIDSTAGGKGGCVELRTTGGQIIRIYATSTFVAGVGIPLYAELGACK